LHALNVAYKTYHGSTMSEQRINDLCYLSQH